MYKVEGREADGELDEVTRLYLIDGRSRVGLGAWNHAALVTPTLRRPYL